jgi:hypothetical protein
MPDDDLEARVRQLEDRLTIIELEGTYARTFDEHRGDDWAALFTEEGVYQARGALDGQTRVTVRDVEVPRLVRGRVDLARFCSSAPFDGIHFLHLPQITFGSGDRAKSRVHFESLTSFDDVGNPFSRTMGYYDVSYVRANDGAWLIERRVTTTFGDVRGAFFGYAPKDGLSPDED